MYVIAVVIGEQQSALPAVHSAEWLSHEARFADDDGIFTLKYLLRGQCETAFGAVHKTKTPSLAWTLAPLAYLFLSPSTVR